MGSASYYSGRDLDAPPSFEDAGATHTLSTQAEVALSFELVFGEGGRVALQPGPQTESAAARSSEE
jgi:hypothetical protein